MPKQTYSDASLVPLPKHVQFARALAGLPKVAVGVAAGAALMSLSACIGSACSGICGVQGLTGTGGTTHQQTGSGGNTGTGGRAFGIAPLPQDGSADAANGGNSGTGGFFGVAPLPQDGSADAARDAGDAGGGPLPAPPFPAAWV